MQLQFYAETLNNEHAAFIITDAVNAVINIGIARMTAITALNDIDLPASGLMTLAVVDRDTDRMALANRFNTWLGQNGHGTHQFRLNAIVRAWSHRNNGRGKAVRCVDTGEQWSTINEAASATETSYAQMHNHLNRRVGYKTVKGRTYEFAVDNDNSHA